MTQATFSRSGTLKRVQELKDAGEDAQWYPTTSEIIGVVCRDIIATVRALRSGIRMSFLDVGAGDGRVLACGECVSLSSNREQRSVKQELDTSLRK